MTFKPSLVSGAIVLALVGHFGYHTVYLSNQRQLNQLREQLTEQQRTQDLRVQVARSLDQVEQLRNRLSQEPDTEWLVREVGKLADEAGIQLTAISPVNPRKLQDFTSLSVAFGFTASYVQLAQLVGSLEHSRLFMRVEHLDVVRNGQGTSQVKLTVSTFYLPPTEGTTPPERSRAAAEVKAGGT